MHYPNIHWTGYPHRRFPRIRVASSRRASVRTRSIARATAIDSIRRSLGPELKRQNKKQRIAFQRRRARKYRTSSSFVRARKLASLRARQHIQVFGWDPEVASKVETLRVPSRPPSVRARVDIRSPGRPYDTTTHTTTINSHDGAGASVCRPRPIQRENLYSLMHVAEVPVYWSKKDPAKRKKSSVASSRALRRVREYAHVEPLGTVGRRRTYRTPQRLGKSQTYDSRIDPRTLLDRGRPTKSAPIISSSTHRTASRLPADNGAQRSSELRRVLESIVTKSNAGSQSVTPSMKSIVQSFLSDSVLRTASQRKALKQFTQELELYLQATKSLPNQTLVSSPSVTTVSAHTIEELQPYKSQFNSAGLAVTSADQRGDSSVMGRLMKAPAPPPTPPKDDRFSRQSMDRHSKRDSGHGRKQVAAYHHYKTDSIPSFDTGTTVMDFTPPHEQTSPRPPRTKRRSSSEHTIMAFTPPHESPPSKPKLAPLPGKALTKRSLPWLRKPESAEISPTHILTDRGFVTASTMKAKTRNPSDVLVSFSVPRDSLIEKVATPKIKVIRRDIHSPSAEIKWPNTELRDEVNAKNSTKKTKMYSDAAIQAVTEVPKEYKITDHSIRYVDAIAQTDVAESGPPTIEERSIVERRSPSITAKSKTFPTNSEKCMSSCNQPKLRVASAQSFKKRRQDQAAQTDANETSRNAEQPINGDSKTPSFKSIPEVFSQNGTYSFASPSPFRRSPVRRSPNKSVEEVQVQRSTARKYSGKALSPADDISCPPIRCAPPLFLCAQCSAEIDPSSINQQSDQISDVDSYTQQRLQERLGSEQRTRSPPRTRWSHTCTARSSLECQQCAPREVSVPSLRQRESTSVLVHALEIAYGQEIGRKYFSVTVPVLTPDWAATLESDLEEIIQSYHSPEEKIVQHKAIADAVAEYTKLAPIADPFTRSSVPKLRLQPTFTGYPPSKERQSRLVKALPVATVFPDTTITPSEIGTISTSIIPDGSRINYRDVFRGLHVATAAAYDEDVAKWIEEITGTGVRKFLADLSAFDGLGFNTLSGVAKRAAKQRRGEIRAWEKLRELRLQEKEENADGRWGNCAVEEKQDYCEDCKAKNDKHGLAKDRKMGFMAGDEIVNLRAGSPARSRSTEEVIDKLIKAKERRSREGLKERAVRMGWRDGSVSGEV